jgi:sulfite reductase alpha subunit-like flavoprotein
MNIYYGSQFGNCEEIAKLLQYRIEKECNILVTCETLNTLTSVIASNKLKPSHLFIICSTYGNGDPPENASKLWRTIKSRTTSKLFEDINFSVLALGNSNYDKFCNFGKNMDKRLEELSGTRTLPLTCIDDVNDFEQSVTIWCDKVIELIKIK